MPPKRPNPRKLFPSNPWIRFAPAAAVLLLAGCAVGPDYRRPETAPPAAFKEAPADWKTAAPSDAADRGTWWRTFNDPELNALEERVAVSNQTLAQNVANYEEARQLARSDRTSFLPLLSANGSAGRSKAPAVANSPVSPSPVNNFSASLAASWEPDLWGKLSRTVESDVATAQADAAALASARLSIQTTLAEDYIQLRVLDQKQQLLNNAVEAYRRSLKISTNKYAVGVAARSDVILAQTQLDSTRAQSIDVGVQRSQLEHAIAVLVGTAPSAFSIAGRPAADLAVPAIPAQMPSSLLERRPDVAQAEREVASANARIGVQTAAYFPAISLTGDLGYQSSRLSKIFEAPFRFWSLGGQVSDALLDWGQRHDQVLAARAVYNGSVANYRQVVLTAFQQVEDNLSGLRILAEEAAVEDVAVNEAAEAARISQNEYNAGTVDYTTVVTAEVTELNNRESALAILEERLVSSAALMAALGGGWDASDLPSAGQVVGHDSQAPEAVAAVK